jgi:hypothetical protein
MTTIYTLVFRRKFPGAHSTDEISDDLSDEYSSLEEAVNAANTYYSDWKDHPDHTRSRWEVERVQFDPAFSPSEHARGEGVTYETVFETEWTTE